jgi:hypothetical protein
MIANKLTIKEASEILQRYEIQTCNLSELIDEEYEEIKAGVYTGGNQIGDLACTTNNVCQGC